MAAQPLFTAMAALSLALGIGANTAIYSFMEAILLRSLPVADPQSLVVIQWHSRQFPTIARSFSGRGYQEPGKFYESPMVPYRGFELLASSPVLSLARRAIRYAIISVSGWRWERGSAACCGWCCARCWGYRWRDWQSGCR